MNYTLSELLGTSMENQTEIQPGQWVPARPLNGPFIERVKGAWAVLTGKADAVFWPGQ